MERRFRTRLDELIDDAEVGPGLLRGLMPRLEGFLKPFVQTLRSPEQQTNATHYVQGLLSDLKSKDVESISYLHDRDRQGLQKFMGQSEWDHEPLLGELAQQVGRELGEADGVIVFDPSGFAKKGTESVGVQRQWCGRLGKIENCQVGIYMGYVSSREHVLVDFRLYLPKEWAKSKRRRKKAGVPAAIPFRTRHELALEMLDERGGVLPHAWVAGDDEMGRCSWFREELRSRQECYLLAVPSNTLVRDLKLPNPPYDGHGRRPRVPFLRVDEWASALPPTSWQGVEVRDGEKGPIATEVAWTLVQARGEGHPLDVFETLVVFRERQGDGSWKHDYLLSNAAIGTPVEEFARVFKAQHRIEDCLKRAKSEAGLADYQVRTWEGWHHHQTLALLATWFLTKETRRGKKMDSRADRPATARADRECAEPDVAPASDRAETPHGEPPVEAKRACATVPLATTQTLTTTTI